MADLDPAAMQQMIAVMGGLAGGMSGLTQQMAVVSGGLSGVKSATLGAADATSKASTGAQAAASGWKAMGGAIVSMVSGPLPSAQQAMSMVGDAIGSGITSASEKAAQALSKLGPEGQAAGAAIEALGAVASATVGTLTTLMGTAIEVTERVSLMRAALEGLTGGAAAGAAAGKQIEALADALPFAKAQTQAWATSLLQVGVAGNQLAAQVKAIAAAQALTAVTGGQGGAAAQAMFTRLAMGGKATEAFMKQVHEGGRVAAKMLAEMGLNIKDLGGELAVSKMNAQQFGDAVTRALQSRGSKALDVLGDGWTNIVTKAREGLLSLFTGIETGPFMKAVKGLFGEFSKGGVAINLLKPIFSSVFNTLFSWAEKATRAIHRGFLLVVIGALTAYIAMRPVIEAAKRIASNAIALAALKTVLMGIAGALVAIALPFILIGAGIVVVMGLVAALAAGFIMLVDAVLSLGSSVLAAFTAAYAAATGAGGSIVDGLIAGVVAGAGAFVAALSGLASQGLAKFKSIFGIASPSKVMLEHGEKNIAGAAATGIDRGSDKVDASMANLGGGAPGGGAGAGRGTTIHVGQVVIQVGEREDAESLYTRFLQLLQGTATEAAQPVGAG